MLTRADAAEVGEGDHQADGAMAAHAQEAHIVEEDDARRAGRVDRLAQESAHHHIGAARLVHHGGAEAIVYFTKRSQIGLVTDLRTATVEEIRRDLVSLMGDGPERAAMARLSATYQVDGARAAARLIDGLAL